MLDNNNLGELEHIIDQLPDRTFSYTYPSGVQVALRHDNLWHGEITSITKPKELHAQTFQEIDDYLLSKYLYGESQQQLLDAAKKQLASQA
jgi:hypothetical protein